MLARLQALGRVLARGLLLARLRALWRVLVRGPLLAQVLAQVLDAETGVRLPSVLTEVTFSGTIPHDGKRHRVPTGEARLSVAGTARLRAESRGYAPLTLSPFLDNPELVRTVTSFRDEDLCNWQSYEEVKRELEKVELVFRLRKAGP